MIKILIVEDSKVVRDYMQYIFDSEPDFQVVGTAVNGLEAIEMVGKIMPDVVLMDINMPVMDGFEATRNIMETSPLPIVLISASWLSEEITTTFKALDAGALTVLEKPSGMGYPGAENSIRETIHTVRLMSEVKVVTRKNRTVENKFSPLKTDRKKALSKISRPEIIAIGTSTGGPVVLQTIFQNLPKDFSVPVVIVQHIAVGFLKGMVEWLTQTTGFPVHIAEHGEHMLSGHAYIAPDNFQMGVSRNKRIVLKNAEQENGLRPSVSYLFRSVAEVYGATSIGILLTGMGVDGAKELKLLKEKGALTIAQDRESSIVHGMPGEALKLGAATYVLPPDKIVTLLNTL